MAGSVFSKGIRLGKLAAFCLLPSLLMVWQPRVALAQGAMSRHSMGEQEEVPPDKLPVPQKLAGIGNVHLQITATPEAQMWFNQGLNLLHDFWEYESARAFQQGVRVDPQCAMCYWGLYHAESSRHSSAKFYARQALAKAVGLERHASKSERLYIDASAAHEAALKSAKDEDSADFSKEVQLLRKLVRHSPKDTQARIFLAEALIDGYEDSGEPRAGQKEALAILQSVLKDGPDNSAANHYWIHAVEASPHPEQALHSATILGSLAPTSGHMMHMPGHIFYRVGDYGRAEKAFAASSEADERYMKEQHIHVDEDWNYVHNLMYAIANLLEEGRLKEATALSEKLTGARGQLEDTLYPWSPRDSVARLDPHLPVALRTADWAQALELLKASQPPAGLSNLVFLKQELTDFAAGMQAVEARDWTKAEESSTRLDAELWRISQKLKDADTETAKEKDKGDAVPTMQIMPDALPKPLVSNLSIMSLELRAGLLVAEKQIDAAKKLFAQAAKEEKGLGYNEPPRYIRPVGETEAAALMAAEAWSDAKEAYKKVLEERPRSGFPLFGIAMTSERSGDVSAAKVEYAEFVAAWKDADPELPQLAHARAYLGQRESGNGADPRR